MASRSQIAPVLAVAAIVAAVGTAVAIDITRIGDPITASTVNFPPAEGPANVIDDTARTKYLNFDGEVMATGFTVTPSGTGIPDVLTIITANDAPNRDPTSFTIEGSDDGVLFTLIASGSLSPSTDRFTLASTPFANSTSYVQYRVLFPTVRLASGANSMQVAEVQLNTAADITSAFDAVTATYQPGASSPPGEGVANLFDNRLGTKFNVLNGNLGPTVVDLTPLVGASTLTGLAYHSANDDAVFFGRTPANITIEGSNDGLTYTQIFTTPLVSASDNFQDQEFEFANATSYTRYRLTLDVPISAVDMQIGDLQLYGTATQSPPVNDDCANARVASAGQTSGTTALANGSDITPCGTGDSADVWYRFTAAASGLVEANTCASTADTTLAVYASCGGALVACDADGCFAQSRVRWNATSGTIYLIRVALEDGATGPFFLDIDTTPEVHTDVSLPLAYNFNGMVHTGEANLPDDPNGYRSISDRGLVIEDAAGSIGVGTLLSPGTGIRYSVSQTARALDIVHLGDRNTVDNGNWLFDPLPDGDIRGIQPAWLPDSNQTGPQTSSFSCTGVVMTPDTRIGVLYQASNGGGFMNLALTFDDATTATVSLEAPDWFFHEEPGDPGFGVEYQEQLGVFTGAENTDLGQTGSSLSVVESIVSTASLIAGGLGDFTGRRLVSITFSNRSNLIAGYAIVAASARDAAPFCPCDFNGVGGLNSQDFFDFLAAFFNASDSADFNCSGAVNSQDFFDFLNCFFTHPPGCI